MMVQDATVTGCTAEEDDDVLAPRVSVYVREGSVGTNITHVLLSTVPSHLRAGFTHVEQRY